MRHPGTAFCSRVLSKLLHRVHMGDNVDPNVLRYVLKDTPTKRGLAILWWFQEAWGAICVEDCWEPRSRCFMDSSLQG